MRRSIRNEDLQLFLDAGWSCVMPDFDATNRQIVEWRRDDAPVIPVEFVSHETIVKAARTSGKPRS